MKSIEQLLEEATQIDGISGFEDEIRTWFINEIKPHVDHIEVDALGNAYAYLHPKNNNKPTLIFEGHLDEVGFIIRHIQENGLMQFQAVGGWFEQNLLSSRCTITSNDGKRYAATISSVAPHLLTSDLRSKTWPIDKMTIDAGFESKEEVLKANINVGSMVVLNGPYQKISENRAITKAVDNRFSLVAMIKLAAQLKKNIVGYNIVFVASVQEEVGLRGASVVVKHTDADVAVVLDCSAADDLSSTYLTFGHIGMGALVRVYDGNFIAHRKFVNLYQRILDENKIPNQIFISNGGTDAGNIHKSEVGVITLTACICARNIHSCSSVVDYRDIKAVIDGLILLSNHFNLNGFHEILFNGQTF